jgi:hypothetical protein
MIKDETVCDSSRIIQYKCAIHRNACLGLETLSKIKPYEYKTWKQTSNVEHSIKQYRQCMYKQNVEAHFRNECCQVKAISITYSKCTILS